MIELIIDISLTTINEIIILSLIILILAILIDVILGELPTKIHPVVLIGNFIDFFSKYLIKFKNRWSGVFLTFFVLLSTMLVSFIILYLASYNIYLFIILSSIILSSTFSIKMLLESAESIKEDLELDLNIARKSMAYLVSRNTKELDENLIISATIETLSENITDSAISPIFYYILGVLAVIFISILNVIPLIFYSNNGQWTTVIILILLLFIPIIYRVINTLDAMVGYKNEKYNYIGYFPAKFDDILNFIPARISGFLIVSASFIYSKLYSKIFDWKNSYHIMMRDWNNSPSPNSGFTMAAVAGALNISLEKKEVYKIGENKKILEKDDINKAVKLSKFTIYLFIILIFLIIILFYLFI